jgi:hypothetical protein
MLLILPMCGLVACTEQQVARPQWEGMTQPGDTVVAYVEALKKNDLERAIAYLYLPKDKDVQMLKGSYMMVVMRVQKEDWKVRIKETLEHNRFATVIYTTKEDLSDPEPMLAAKDDEGHWRLYHMATAGNLGSLFRGSDLDDARFVVRKGQERMAEIRGMMRRRAEAGVKP